MVALLTSFIALMAISSTRRHAKLRRSIAEYAAEFKVSERTVKFWVRRGKDIGHKPPLDLPGKMAGWFADAFGRKVPDYLLAFNEPSSRETEQPAPTLSSVDVADSEILDIEQRVHQLQRTMAKCQKLLDESFTTTNQKNYRDCFDLLRKAEMDQLELQRARGNLINKESIKSELAQLFEALRLMRETMARRVMVEVEKACPRRLARIFRSIQKLLEPAVEKVRMNEDQIFRQLQSIDGTSALESQLVLVSE